MTTLPDVERRVAHLRARLANDPYGAVADLVALADDVAGDRQLFHNAVWLQQELASPEVSPSPELMRELAALLDQIAADYRRQAETGHFTALERQQRLAEIYRETAKRTIPEGVALDCDHVTKSYGPGKFTLSDVSFKMNFGEITGVMGRNGNGKTTLFRLIVGELSPSHGKIRYPALEARGRSWSRIRRQIAYVPQDLPSWYGSLLSNLHYEAAIHGLRGDENKREVNYMVERLGLGAELDKTWNELSGGFKLRFALARAFVQSPRLLILDEPLANLDFETQEVVLKDIRQLTNSISRPVAVLVSSQHVHEIEEIADKILFLHEGKPTYCGAIGGIGRARVHNRFEIGGSFDLADLQAALTGDGVISIHHSGVAFVVTTIKGVSPAQLMQRLIASRLSFDYFRDISQSTKSLFEQARISEGHELAS